MRDDGSHLRLLTLQILERASGVPIALGEMTVVLKPSENLAIAFGP